MDYFVSKSPSNVLKDERSSVKSLLTSAGPSRESAPPFTMAIWDEWGKVCILAKIEASFTITYDTNYGKQVRRSLFCIFTYPSKQFSK